MTWRDTHAFFAAMLPVCLGLGLIYLYAMGRIAAWTVFTVLLGSVVGIVAMVFIREAAVARGPHPTRGRPEGQRRGA